MQQIDIKTNETSECSIRKFEKLLGSIFHIEPTLRSAYRRHVRISSGTKRMRVLAGTKRFTIIRVPEP